jgi:hypothetical protein
LAPDSREFGAFFDESNPLRDEKLPAMYARGEPMPLRRAKSGDKKAAVAGANAAIKTGSRT